MLKISSFNKRLEALRSERSSFIPLWRELSDYHLSHRGRFLVSERNKGNKRNTKQINNTSLLSGRTLASGLMSGITSPSRPWFRLSSGDDRLDDKQNVKLWLHAVEKIMYKVFAQSNTYTALHQIYSELGTFGIGAMGIFRDFDNVIWCKPYTVGSYMVGLNSKNISDSFYLEYEISVAQCVKQFGIENCSQDVKRRWEKGDTESWVKIVHVIEPNDNRDMMSPMARDKRWRSVYYEDKKGARDAEDKFLRRSGFNNFPVVTPRWDVVAGDVYPNHCPGMAALGDTKSLQLAERRKYQALDKLVNPPLQGPVALKGKLKGGAPGANEVVYTDASGKGLDSIYDFRPDIDKINGEIDRVESRIQRAFYEDLFLMLAQTDRRQITAREVAEKHEEKLLMLGPVLERLHTELLDPLIDRTFMILSEAGVLPPPPDELLDRNLTVAYVSVLAQAQRMVATGAVERLFEFTGQLSTIWPEARHKVDVNKAVNEYAESLGVDPDMVRSDDEAMEFTKAEQQAAQAAQQAASLQQGAETAKTASEVDGSITDLLGGIL